MQEQHPNVTLINNFFQAYAAYDLKEIEKILSPDIQWHIPGIHPFSGTKTGIPEVLGYFKALGQFDFKAKPIVLGVNDDYVIDCHLNWSNGKEGENTSFMSCLLWKFSNGKVVEVYNFQQDQHLVDNFFNNTQKLAAK
jgi:ketosteroid isomerase-like protein